MSSKNSNINLVEECKKNESTRNSNLDTKVSNLSSYPRNSIDARGNCKLDEKFAMNPHG